jgi:hypothetical protein
MCAGGVESLSGSKRQESAQGTLFEDRFLGRYAGAIMSDPTTALVELVANTWDAYATHVEITWPDASSSTMFSITDNGIGMTRPEFEVRWRTLDYDRVAHEGEVVMPPSDLQGAFPRPVYGRNGKGRLAGFLFSSPYRVRTWRDGKEAIFRVSQGQKDPIKVDLEATGPRAGHGTEIAGMHLVPSALTPSDARALLSTRFLTNPAFSVSVDGIRVTFDDVPPDSLGEVEVNVLGHGTVKIVVIDSQRTDRTAKQHGIAWWVNNRLVGESGWSVSDHDRIVDGRTELAKRFTFIVKADHLASAVKEDWSDFRPTDTSWLATQAKVQDKIREIILTFSAERRARTKASVSSAHKAEVNQLSVLSRDRWTRFLDQIVEKCPNLADTQIDQIMGLLVNLEASETQYSLLRRLHDLPPDDLDKLDDVLDRWTVTTAKEVLDEVEKRLRVIEEIRVRTSDRETDEVQELQPLFARALWIFGPQFEGIEFTSNQGMTTVMRKLYGAAQPGSRNRPDFAMTPDSTIGFYSRPSYDSDFNPSGTETLVIVELKKPGVRIGADEKDQVWKYVSELMDEGFVTDNTTVYGFVLGDSIRSADNRERKEGDRTYIRPMLYSTFITQAHKRMLNLRETVISAPFMQAFLAGLEGQPSPSGDLLSPLREVADDSQSGTLPTAIREIGRN